LQKIFSMSKKNAKTRFATEIARWIALMRSEGNQVSALAAALTTYYCCRPRMTFCHMSHSPAASYSLSIPDAFTSDSIYRRESLRPTSCAYPRAQVCFERTSNDFRKRRKQ
jgi:hypothetical protein